MELLLFFLTVDILRTLLLKTQLDSTPSHQFQNINVQRSRPPTLGRSRSRVGKTDNLHQHPHTLLLSDPYTALNITSPPGLISAVAIVANTAQNTSITSEPATLWAAGPRY
ncbi:hypothetical protein GWI33_014619 [Rhynchophorus ferrugineus]|uniref:Uncharacterized protein n=1 Tax=Rhynchophorus ferrugineus TaxID=354439 RepID=A0A834IES3_RHYFE|nr:hypothetical protein GWI33_014619 [Rhynchophorus ferrugineus]